MIIIINKLQFHNKTIVHTSNKGVVYQFELN